MVTSGVLTQRTSVLDCASACKRQTRIAQRFTRNFLSGFLHVVLRRQSEIHYRRFLWKNFRLGKRNLRPSAWFLPLLLLQRLPLLRGWSELIDAETPLLLMPTIVISPTVQWFHSSSSDPGP